MNYSHRNLEKITSFASHIKILLSHILKFRKHHNMVAIYKPPYLSHHTKKKIIIVS